MLRTVCVVLCVRVPHIVVYYCVIHGIRYFVCDVLCVVCGVLCLICGSVCYVWCVVCGMLYDACDA